MLAIISLDLIIIASHILFGYKSDFFNLDVEANVPTYYQGIKFLIVGFFLFVVFLRGRLIFLIPLAVLLLYLGIDEIVQIHENFGSLVKTHVPSFAAAVESLIKTLEYKSSKWVIYLAPVILITLGYVFFISLYAKIKKYDSFPPLAAGSILFLFVIVFEIINSWKGHSWLTYQILMTFEESFEIFGTSSFAYAGYLEYLKHQR